MSSLKMSSKPGNAETHCEVEVPYEPDGTVFPRSKRSRKDSAGSESHSPSRCRAAGRAGGSCRPSVSRPQRWVGRSGSPSAPSLMPRQCRWRCARSPRAVRGRSRPRLGCSRSRCLGACRPGRPPCSQSTRWLCCTRSRRAASERAAAGLAPATGLARRQRRRWCRLAAADTWQRCEGPHGIERINLQHKSATDETEMQRGKRRE